MFLGLTLDELTEVLRTCESIEIEDCTPPYLKDFIASHLDNSFPAIAGKVRAFDGEHMDALCEHIKETYFLIRK